MRYYYHIESDMVSPGRDEMIKKFKYNGPYIVTTRGFRVISGHVERRNAANICNQGVSRTVWAIRPDGKGYEAVHGYHADC